MNWKTIKLTLTYSFVSCYILTFILAYFSQTKQTIVTINTFQEAHIEWFILLLFGISLLMSYAQEIKKELQSSKVKTMQCNCGYSTRNAKDLIKHIIDNQHTLEGRNKHYPLNTVDIDWK